MRSGGLSEGLALRIGNIRAPSRIHLYHMRTPLHNYLAASLGLKRSQDVSRAMSAVDLACRGWRERGCNEVEATVGVLRDLRLENNTVTTRAVGRRLRTFLVQSFLLSMPEQKSPDAYTAWLGTICPVDREERAQHLLAYSKWVPKPKKKRVRPGRQQAARDTPEERRVAFEIVSAAMDDVGAFMIADSAALS